jgi:hypothetical protein
MGVRFQPLHLGLDPPEAGVRVLVVLPRERWRRAPTLDSSVSKNARMRPGVMSSTPPGIS